MTAKRKRRSFSLPAVGWVGSRGLAPLPGSRELPGADQAGRILPPETPFSSVSSKSLQEPQSEGPGSQTAPWKQRGWVWVGLDEKNSVSRAGRSDAIATA